MKVCVEISGRPVTFFHEHLPMHSCVRKLLVPALLLVFFPCLTKALPLKGLWREAPAGFEKMNGKPRLQPDAYRIFLCAEDSLQRQLLQSGNSFQDATIITLPRPDGKLRQFRIWQSPMMAPALAQRYPGLHTFTAEALDNPRVSAKIDYTSFGFHAYVFDGASSYLIDPCYSSPQGAYLVYFKKDFSRPSDNLMFCAAEGESSIPPIHAKEQEAARQNGNVRKIYRLALAADYEYCVAVAGAGPTKAAVLAKMVTTMNRVNGVYEREFSVTMQLIANEDTLIFNTDPTAYSNNNGPVMLGQNQTIVDARIGTANYDIGHVFSTGGGGIASQGVICNTNSKARGVTGRASPMGDGFDIDYVAHEMGHQFGAGHTFNASTGSCAGNGVRNLSFEPGSGSTIMAYAGICGGGNDFQNHSDDYFHFASLDQIGQFITTGGGHTCAQLQSAPDTTVVQLPGFAASYYIPLFTPFELESPRALNADSGRLSYCWEQADAGGRDFGKSLADTHLDGPLFRSFLPDTSRTRVFPSLVRLLGGLSTPGEKLPDTGRDLHFRLSCREVHAGWGNFDLSTDYMTLHAVQGAGPFRVLSSEVRDTVSTDLPYVVRWDVAGTDAAPINCEAVDIFLSTDGGRSFPYALLKGTANDGAEAVWLPHLPVTDSARIKVKGAGNVFFNINASNFRIQPFDTLPTPPPPAPVSQKFSVWPNPVNHTLYVRVADSLGNVPFTLFNPMGQVVMRSAVAGKAALDVSQLARGLYFLHLYGPKLDARVPVLVE